LADNAPAPAESYAALYRDFRWTIPARFNIAEACVDRWAAGAPDRTALIRTDGAGGMETIAYGTLKADSDRLALALGRRGLKRGDRIAILLPQSVETVLAHLAAYKLGAVAVPLAALFGPEALAYRLKISGAKAIVTDGTGLDKVAKVSEPLPDLDIRLSTDGAAAGAESFHSALGSTDGAALVPETTTPDDPAMMIFTSGTTGPPKGALHGHSVLIGHLPGLTFSHEFLPQPDDRIWTPSDWAWAGGLLNALLPALYFGVPVVFGPFRPFDPDEALALMATAGVRNAFLPPTAIRMLMSVPAPRDRYDLKLRTIGSAGESLGRAAYAWSRDALGIIPNEFFGQTECNYVLGSCGALGVTRAGAIGKPVPGHRVAVIDPAGQELPPGEPGQIAVRRPNPSMFLEYWQRPEATAEKFVGDWMVTGDQGVMDEDGYFRFVGRDDDLITSAGYRIGPSEIEDCLLGHPAVALAAAVGKPDRLRTEIVKAYVKLKPDSVGSPALADDIKRFVRERLSAAEYPREVAFVDDIPLTTTGKVIRRHFRDAAAREAGLADDGGA
jgi:acetyl-CoA synthetase